jgi:transposase-like protein
MEPITSKKSRSQYSSEQRQQLLGEFKESKMSASEFSRLHGINVSAFGKWLTRERRKGGTPSGRQARKQARPTGFAELQISQSPAQAAKAVLYAEVHSIRIYQPVSASYLKELQ